MKGTKTDLVCRVKDCEYHDSSDICTARAVEVGGKDCTSSCDTECVTFRPHE